MTQSQLDNLIQSTLTMVDLFMVTKANLMINLPIRDVTTTNLKEITIATISLIEEVLTKILLEETTNLETTSSGEMMEVIDGAKRELRKTIDHLREVES